MKLTREVKIVIGVVLTFIVVLVLLELAHNQENQTSVSVPSEEDINCNRNATTYEQCISCKSGVWCSQQMKCKQYREDASGNSITC